MTDPAITPDDLASLIDTIFSRDDLGRGLQDWTKLLGSHLKVEAAARGCHAWGNHIGPGRREYLVDYCWSIGAESEKDWQDYTGLVLAAEIEWGGTRDAIWEDFVKLIDVRASARLFVANMWPEEWTRVDRILEEMASFVANHRHASDQDWVVVVLSCKTGSEAHRISKIDRRNAEPALSVWSDVGGTGKKAWMLR